MSIGSGTGGNGIGAVQGPLDRANCYPFHFACAKTPTVGSIRGRTCLCPCARRKQWNTRRVASRTFTAGSARHTVLLWRGMQTDARAAVGPLAALLAGTAPPWWRPIGAPAHPTAVAMSCCGPSISRGHAPRATTASCSSDGRWGGAAAAGLTLAAARLAVPLAHTVCLAAAFMVADPISGHRATEQLSAYRAGTPFTLLHGAHDGVVPLAAGRGFAARLREVGWPVDLHEVSADHGTIAGAASRSASARPPTNRPCAWQKRWPGRSRRRSPASHRGHPDSISTGASVFVGGEELRLSDPTGSVIVRGCRPQNQRSSVSPRALRSP